MTLFKLIFVITVVLCFVSSLVLAKDVQDITRTGPCKTDIEKFCKNVKPGKGRILKCMKQYERYLSDACKDDIGEVKEKTRAFVKACKMDTQKFCSDVLVGQGRVYRCLKQHQTELAAKCADYLR